MTDPVAHAVRRGDLTDQILTCHRCRLRALSHSPVPPRGSSPNPLMMLAEAPGVSDAKYGRPLVGQLGRLMDRLLADASLPPLNQWFVTHAVCCHSPSGPPENDEMMACHPNLRAQVELCDPAWIVTLGAVPLRSIGIKSPITKVHGRPFEVLAGPAIGRMVFPTFHPAVGFRDESKLTQIVADLSTLYAVMCGTISLSDIKVRAGRNGKLDLNV